MTRDDLYAILDVMDAIDPATPRRRLVRFMLAALYGSDQVARVDVPVPELLQAVYGKIARSKAGEIAQRKALRALIARVQEALNNRQIGLMFDLHGQVLTLSRYTALRIATPARPVWGAK